jgi:hypothetical protein
MEPHSCYAEWKIGAAFRTCAARPPMVKTIGRLTLNQLFYADPDHYPEEFWGIEDPASPSCLN